MTLAASYLSIKQCKAFAHVSDKPVQPFSSLFNIAISYLHHSCRLQKFIITRKPLNALFQPADLFIAHRDLFLQGRILTLQLLIAEHELSHPCRKRLQNFFLGIHDDSSPNGHQLTAFTLHLTFSTSSQPLLLLPQRERALSWQASLPHKRSRSPISARS